MGAPQSRSRARGRTMAVSRCSTARQLSLLGTLALSLSALAGAQGLDALLSRSQFIFQGTVKAIGTATEPAFPVDSRTAVIQVDQVYRPVAGPYYSLKGKRVTVRLKGDSLLKIGDAAIFLTRSWLFGDTLAVVEIYHMNPTEGASLPARIRDAENRAFAAQLRDRVARAQLIVVGTVKATCPASSYGAPPLIAEHDPDWWVATIEVHSVLMGEPPSALHVLFPNSTDLLWRASPKLRTGTVQILILQRDQKERGMPVLHLLGLTALDELDVLSLDRLEQIRSIIAVQTN